MKQQEQQRARAKMSYVQGQQAVSEMIEDNASQLVNRINDRVARRAFELNRQVSITREKNAR